MINKFYGSPYKYFYGIAGAPFFDLGEANSRNDLTSDDVLQALKTSSLQTSTVYRYDTNAAIAIYYQMSIYVPLFSLIY